MNVAPSNVRVTILINRMLTVGNPNLSNKSLAIKSIPLLVKCRFLVSINVTEGLG